MQAGGQMAMFVYSCKSLPSKGKSCRSLIGKQKTLPTVTTTCYSRGPMGGLSVFPKSMFSK